MGHLYHLKYQPTIPAILAKRKVHYTWLGQENFRSTIRRAQTFCINQILKLIHRRLRITSLKLKKKDGKEIKFEKSNTSPAPALSLIKAASLYRSSAIALWNELLIIKSKDTRDILMLIKGASSSSYIQVSCSFANSVTCSCSCNCYFKPTSFFVIFHLNSTI